MRILPASTFEGVLAFYTRGNYARGSEAKPLLATKADLRLMRSKRLCLLLVASLSNFLSCGI